MMQLKLTALAVALFLILFLPLVSSVEITNIEQNVLNNTEELTKLKAETTAKMTEINTKLDKFLTKDDMTKMLTAHLTITDKLLDSYKTSMTISWVLTSLATLGAFFGIYFYWKGKRRI